MHLEDSPRCCFADIQGHLTQYRIFTEHPSINICHFHKLLIPDCVDSDAYLFADDTKIYKIIKEDNDREALQQDLKKMTEWSEKWLLKFHPQKCKSMNIAKTKNETEYNYNLEGQNIEWTQEERDVGRNLFQHKSEWRRFGIDYQRKQLWPHR